MHKPIARGDDLGDHAVVVGLVAECGEGGGLGEAVDVVAVTHAVEQVDDLGVGEGVADADAGEGVGLGERADDDEIRETREELDRVFPRERRVGLVDDEQSAIRREHLLEVGVGEGDAGGRVGRGEEKRARRGGSDLFHGQAQRAVELDHARAAILDADEHGVERIARQRETGRGVLRAERADEEIENVVGAVADADVFFAQAVAVEPGDGGAERRALRIWVKPQRGAGVSA